MLCTICDVRHDLQHWCTAQNLLRTTRSWHEAGLAASASYLCLQASCRKLAAVADVAKEHLKVAAVVSGQDELKEELLAGGVCSFDGTAVVKATTQHVWLLHGHAHSNDAFDERRQLSGGGGG